MGALYVALNQSECLRLSQEGARAGSCLQRIPQRAHKPHHKAAYMHVSVCTSIPTPNKNVVVIVVMVVVMVVVMMVVVVVIGMSHTRIPIQTSSERYAFCIHIWQFYVHSSLPPPRTFLALSQTKLGNRDHVVPSAKAVVAVDGRWWWRGLEGV